MCVSASLSHLRGRTRPRKLSRYGTGRLFGQTLYELCLRNGPDWNGGPGRSRTADQRFRKPLLYPTELRGHSARLAVIGAETIEKSYEKFEHLYSSEFQHSDSARLGAFAAPHQQDLSQELSGRSYVMYQPPFTEMVCPVMYSLPASITAIEATSSTLPKCPIGISRGLALALLVTMSVSISAGAMAFTVIPSLTKEEAQECVRPMIPALDAA